MFNAIKLFEFEFDLNNLKDFRFFNQDICMYKINTVKQAVLAHCEFKVKNYFLFDPSYLAYFCGMKYYSQKCIVKHRRDSI
jgi:hypothetical protein